MIEHMSHMIMFSMSRRVTVILKCGLNDHQGAVLPAQLQVSGQFKFMTRRATVASTTDLFSPSFSTRSWVFFSRLAINYGQADITSREDQANSFRTAKTVCKESVTSRNSTNRTGFFDNNKNSKSWCHIETVWRSFNNLFKTEIKFITFPTFQQEKPLLIEI